MTSNRTFHLSGTPFCEGVADHLEEVEADTSTTLKRVGEPSESADGWCIGGNDPHLPQPTMTKGIFITAAFASFAATTPVQAEVVFSNGTTYIDQQTRTCHDAPARDTGFIRVGNVTERIIAKAYTSCAWVGGDTRTRIQTTSQHFVF